jgi:hypothetical protein
MYQLMISSYLCLVPLFQEEEEERKLLGADSDDEPRVGLKLK